MLLDLFFDIDSYEREQFIDYQALIDSDDDYLTIESFFYEDCFDEL